MTKVISIAIKYILTAVMTIIWSIIGFICWVPLVVKVTTIYVCAVTASLYANINMRLMNHSLNTAVVFYLRGFEQIMSFLEDNRSIQMEDQRYNQPPVHYECAQELNNVSVTAGLVNFIKIILPHFVFTTMFWGILFVIVKYRSVLPLF